MTFPTYPFVHRLILHFVAAMLGCPMVIAEDSEYPHPLLHAATNPPVITSQSGANGTIGSPFAFDVFATNPPDTFAATGLQPGLSIASSTGLIKGTPSTSVTTNVQLNVSNGVAPNATGTLQLIITAPPSGSPVITSVAQAVGAIGQLFTFPIQASNSPSNYSAFNLPPWLSIDPNSGILSGVPPTIGISDIEIEAGNLKGTNATWIVLTVETVAQLTPSITSALTATAQVGFPFSYSITASNTPTNFAVTGLPIGLACNTSSGVISGTPSPRQDPQQSPSWLPMGLGPDPRPCH